MIVFITLASVLAAFTVILYAIYRKTFYHNPKGTSPDPYSVLSRPYLDGMRELVKQQIDDLTPYPCEEIYINSYDGTRLFARYYESDVKKPVCILFHGYKGSSYAELSGAALLMLSYGFGVIITDERAHGKSGGKTITFGIKERLDCKAWVDYARQRFGEGREIILYGMSMGASTVLMASELLPHPGVKAIIADCPYSDPTAIIKRVMSNHGLPTQIFFPLVRLSALIFGRFSITAASPTDAVKQSQIPTLLIHGEDDHFVPPEMSEEIFNASSASKRSRFTVEGAKHGESFAKGMERYVAAVLDFINGIDA